MKFNIKPITEVASRVKNVVKENWKLPFLLAILVGTIWASVAMMPAPQPLLQVRAERLERFHEAGKDVHAFAQGVRGK